MLAPAQTENHEPLAHHDLEKEIVRLKRQMNAVILAHFYQESEIQDLADFVGDSLQLSQKAAATSADVIVFCGVLFMAETAKILNPSKSVLLPDLKAGCSLADGHVGSESLEPSSYHELLRRSLEEDLRAGIVHMHGEGLDESENPLSSLQSLSYEPVSALGATLVGQSADPDSIGSHLQLSAGRTAA
ncbi:MAG: quinolinate synthase NadA [Candidatus Sulfotelmatobacter sp.]|jgi:hypothetical protein